MKRFFLFLIAVVYVFGFPSISTVKAEEKVSCTAVLQRDNNGNLTVQIKTNIVFNYVYFLDLPDQVIDAIDVRDNGVTFDSVLWDTWKSADNTSSLHNVVDSVLESHKWDFSKNPTAEYISLGDGMYVRTKRAWHPRLNANKNWIMTYGLGDAYQNTLSAVRQEQTKEATIVLPHESGAYPRLSIGVWIFTKDSFAGCNPAYYGRLEA